MSITNSTQPRKAEENLMLTMVESVAASYRQRSEETNDSATRVIALALAELASEIRITGARNADDFEDRRACMDKWRDEKLEIDAIERERAMDQVRQAYRGDVR